MASVPSATKLSKLPWVIRTELPKVRRRLRKAGTMPVALLRLIGIGFSGELPATEGLALLLSLQKQRYYPIGTARWKTWPPDSHLVGHHAVIRIVAPNNVPYDTMMRSLWPLDE